MIGILLLIDVETLKIYIEIVVTWPGLFEIYWINYYPVDSLVCFVNTYSSGG